MSEANESQSTSQAAERIASGGDDVRERVRRLVVETAAGRPLKLSEMRDEASKILEGAQRGVEEISEERRGTVLAEVIDGLSDGFSRAAYATKLAIEEAEGRGQRFADEDIKKATEDLKDLEKMFVDTVSEFARHTGGKLRDQADDLVTHAKRSAQSMRPGIESAIGAAAKHPLQFTKESAAAGVDAARRATGSLLQAAAGFLAGAGEVVSGGEKDKGRSDAKN